MSPRVDSSHAISTGFTERGGLLLQGGDRFAKEASKKVGCVTARDEAVSLPGLGIAVLRYAPFAMTDELVDSGLSYGLSNTSSGVVSLAMTEGWGC